MRTPTPLPPLPSPLVTVDELRRSGVSPTRLRARDLHRVVHGVVLLPTRAHDPLAARDGAGGPVHAVELRLTALLRTLSPGQFLTRRTAARALGLPVLEQGTAIEIGAIRPTRPPRRPGVAGHQLRAGALAEIPLPPWWLPSPSEVWCLLAQVAGLDELVAAGDRLVSGASRWERPQTSIAALGHAVRRFARCTGSTLRTAALPLIRTGVESPGETRLRLLLIRAGLPEPVVSCAVPTARRVFRADLGYPELCIALEYEGEYHFQGGTEQARIDVARHEAMRDAGWIVLRVTALDLREASGLLFRLRRAMASHR